LDITQQVSTLLNTSFMAFGLLPKHAQSITLAPLTTQQIWTLALQATRDMGWKIGDVNASSFKAYTRFSMSSYGEEVTFRVKEHTLHIESKCTGNQIYDWGKNKQNIITVIGAIKKLRQELSEEEIEARYLTFTEQPLSDTTLIPQEEELNPIGGNKNFLSLFIPTKGYFITPILVYLNVLVFIIMVLSGVHILDPTGEDLVKWGANFEPYTLIGQWWRLLTCCFVHIGIVHLLFNMYALTYIGLLLEPYMGRVRFLTAYLFTGIVASMVSVLWNDYIISAGASGAIFGMYGVFLALLTTNLVHKSARVSLFSSMGIFIAYNLFSGLKTGSGVDNAAHIGGLLSGLLIGYIFLPSIKRAYETTYTYITIGGLSLALLFSCFIFLDSPEVKYNSEHMAQYEKEMTNFAAMESWALEVFNLPDSTSDKVILRHLEDKGIYYWNECILLLESFDDLDLPDPIKAHNQKLKKYCNLRLKSYRLIYKSIEENTDQYNREIEKYHREIDQIIRELTGQ